MPRKNKSNEQKILSLLQQLVLQPKAPAASKKKRKRKNKAAGNRLTQSDPGGMTIARRELLMEVAIAANKDAVYKMADLRPDNFHFLKGIAKSFERFRFTKLNIYWKPAVGTTYGGMVAIGIDWDFSDNTAQTRADITSYTPSQSFSCWSDTERTPLVLPPSRLQSRNWYATSATTFDGGVGRLKIAANGETSPNTSKTVGELWIDYRVQFSGTQP